MRSLLRSSGELLDSSSSFFLMSFKDVYTNPLYCLKCCRWRTLEGAALDLSSVSFFGEEKHETAVSKWARARKRAAKV